MVQSTHDRATCRTGPDGWMEIRDQYGRLWCEYHPERKVIRRSQKLYGRLTHVEIPIDSLIAGAPIVTVIPQ